MKTAVGPGLGSFAASGKGASQILGDSPVDFTIVIDTREQQPYAFGCASERRKLDAGDYSVAGCESQIAVERTRKRQDGTA